MSDHYQYVNVANVREDSAEIVSILGRIYRGELPSDIRLLNFYEEIPVNYPARIEYLEDDMVDLSTHQHQTVVMKLEKKTIIKSRHFPHEVLANVFRVDVGKSLATVTNFAYVQVKAERRRFVRVTLKEPHEAVFVAGDQRVRGTIYDISLSGIALLTSDPPVIDTMTDGTLLFSIGDRPISLEARLIKIIPESSRNRYIFDFQIDSRDETAISQFIFQRQVEIIKELKDSII